MFWVCVFLSECKDKTLILDRRTLGCQICKYPDPKQKYCLYIFNTVIFDGYFANIKSLSKFFLPWKLNAAVNVIIENQMSKAKSFAKKDFLDLRSITSFNLHVNHILTSRLLWGGDCTPPTIAFCRHFYLLLDRIMDSMLFFYYLELSF